MGALAEKPNKKTSFIFSIIEVFAQPGSCVVRGEPFPIASALL